VNKDHSFWHARYQQQTKWTLATRRYIFDQIGICSQDHILETGCGSGAVLETLFLDSFDHLTGIDKDSATLLNAHIPHKHICANGLTLPFPNGTFAHSLCHFYLLWTVDPHLALHEMRRVTQPGGWVLAIAEPDYGGRISTPHALKYLAELQTLSLDIQGADVQMGRHLRGLFAETGLEDIQGGIIAAQWTPGSHESSFIEDQETLLKDVDGLIEMSAFDNLMDQAEESIAVGHAFWYVPIFYAFGRVTDE
jgi:SAM-dependent methyltransferase